MKTEIVVLCEGDTDATFIRSFLRRRGYDARRQVRFVVGPKGRGSGEQFVRQKLPNELSAYRNRQNPRLIALIVMTDADVGTVVNRKNMLDRECETADVPKRRLDESVLYIIPRRHAETWYVYLNGESWDEEADYRNRKQDDLAKLAAAKLHRMCFEQQRLNEPSPQSLQDACEEWKRMR
jgi:hypothetical protein